MFEFFLALKYLIPRRTRLSASLVAFLSVGVISLVVWLILVFLSITEGIERNWLGKLTTLNAPLRVTPTEEYYASYYYQIDNFSAASHYTTKSLKEKSVTEKADPYNPAEDEELPEHFPKPDCDEVGYVRDPVKGLLAILNETQGIVYQDFELGGALLRLQLLNEMTGGQGYLTQASYLATLPDHAPGFSSLLLPPTEADLNHLLFLSGHSTELARQDAPSLQLKTSRELHASRVNQLLKGVKIEQLKTSCAFWQIPFALLPEKQPFLGCPQYRNGMLYRIDIPTQKAEAKEGVSMWREGDRLCWKEGEPLSKTLPLLVKGPLVLDVLSSSSARFHVESSLQALRIEGEVGLEGLEIARAVFPQKQLSSCLGLDAEGGNEEKEVGVLLAKSFIDNGVKVGDRGYLAYSSSTASSLQEHRLPIFVSGFYDPGVLSVGNKCILVPPLVTQTVNASSSSFNLDKTQSTGFLVWFSSLERAGGVKKQIEQALKAQGLDKQWRVSTFYEYDFAKDLLQQFQSDKLLFMLVGIIILIVGCCNIVSMLVLLVNDKSKEIGILQAMGATRLHIATLFGICGVVLGLVSSLIGVGAALFTLGHIDSLVQFLSLLQGHDAFNATFFGTSLPNTLSHGAAVFVLIVTPLLSLIAGLIPAVKACCLQPSTLLRNP